MNGIWCEVVEPVVRMLEDYYEALYCGSGSSGEYSDAETNIYHSLPFPRDFSILQQLFGKEEIVQQKLQTLTGSCNFLCKIFGGGWIKSN